MLSCVFNKSVGDVLNSAGRRLCCEFRLEELNVFWF